MLLESLIKELESLKNDKKAEFDKKIVHTSKAVFLGVNSNDLKKIAKNIIKNNSLDEVLNLINNITTGKYYELDLIKSLLINYSKLSINEYIELIDQYSYSIDNWATCDSTVTNYKIKKCDLSLLYKYVEKLSFDQKYPFRTRLGIVYMIKYGMEKEVFLSYLNILENINVGDYYIDMAISWFLSYGCIYHFDETINYLLTSKNINKFIYKKTLQKALESYRISDENKILIREYRHKRFKNEEF